MQSPIIRARALHDVLVFIVMYFAVFGTGVAYMLKLVANRYRAAMPPRR